MRIGRLKICLICFMLGAISQAQTEEYESEEQTEDQLKWTLSACIDYALHNNIQVSKAILDIQDSQVDKMNVLGNFLPNLSITVGHSWNIGLNQNITTGLLQNTTTQYSNLGANASITVFNGLQNIKRLMRSNMQILASTYKLEDMKDNIALNVSNAYLQILFNKEIVLIEQSQLETLRSDKTKIQAQIDSGNLPEGDILEVEASIANQEQKIIKVINDVELAKLNLRQLINKDNVDVVETNNGLQVPDSQILLATAEEAYKESLNSMSSVRAGRANIEVSKKDLEVARSRYFPSLTAGIRYNTRASYSDVIVGSELDANNPTRQIGLVQGTNQSVISPNFRNIVGPAKGVIEQFQNNDGISYGLNLSIPIFSGFSTRASVKKAKNNIIKRQLDLDNTELDLKSKVFQAWSSMQSANKSYIAAKKVRNARAQAYKYAEVRFKAGVISVFEYNQAFQAFNRSKTGLVRSKYDLIFKIKVLEYYFNIPINDMY